MNDLTNTPLPALERLARVRQGWHTKIRNDEMRHRWMLIRADGRALTDWCSSEEEAWMRGFRDDGPFTADEYLSLLDGLPRTIQGEIVDGLWHLINWTEESFLFSEALKRAILIVYLDNPTGM